MKIANLLATGAAVFTVAANANAAVFGLHGITDPTVPTGYVANEVIWNGAENEPWPSMALRIDLSAGSFYQHPYGADGSSPQFVIDLFPTLEFDTYVGIIGDGTGGIAGGAGDIGGGPFSMDAPQLSVSWFNTSNTDTGYLRVGMMTLSDDAVGTGILYSYGVEMPFTITNGSIADTFENVAIDPFDPPELNPPGPFPVLPGPLDANEVGIFTRLVASPDVPDGYVANEVIWNGQGNEDWFSADMRVDLASGEVFNHPLGSDTAPNELLIDSYPELAFDTYVGIVGDTGENGATGGADELNAESFSMADDHVSVHWYNKDPNNTGIERIGMLTLSEDANGMIAFKSGNTQWSATIVNGVVIPEPTIPALLALTSPALLLKRRT